MKRDCVEKNSVSHEAQASDFAIQHGPGAHATWRPSHFGMRLQIVWGRSHSLAWKQNNQDLPAVFLNPTGLELVQL